MNPFGSSTSANDVRSIDPGYSTGVSSAATLHVGREHLMTVDVSREHRREVRGNVAWADDVGGSREREVPGSDGRALDAVMDAQQPEVRALLSPVGLLEQFREARSHIAPLVGKTRERDRRAAHAARRTCAACRRCECSDAPRSARAEDATAHDCPER